MISSGWAAFPEDETTYFAFSSPGAGAPVDDAGNVDGRVL